jgi:2'-5' RNA ligase
MDFKRGVSAGNSSVHAAVEINHPGYRKRDPDKEGDPETVLTMEEGIRAFIAFELPNELIGHVSGLLDQLRSYSLKIRWVKPHHLHLTLKFLGNISESRIDPIKRLIQEVAKGGGPIRLFSHRIGIFQSLRKPRVLWLGLEGDVNEIWRIRQDLENRLAEIGFQRESRPFRMHLTLGRFKEKVKPHLGELERLLREMEPVRSPEFRLIQMTFFQSSLTPSGPVYTKLSTVML